MHKDERFAERIRRIESGRTWASDGVVRPKEPPRRRVRVGHLIWLVILGAIGTALLRPDLAAHFFEAAWLSDALARASALPFVSDVLESLQEG